MWEEIRDDVIKHCKEHNITILGVFERKHKSAVTINYGVVYVPRKWLILIDKCKDNSLIRYLVTNDDYIVLEKIAALKMNLVAADYDLSRNLL